MKPIWSNILVAVLIIACAVAGYNLYNKVITEEAIQQRVKIQEKEIKEKLLFHVTIQKLSLRSQGKYLSDWKNFKSFIDTGKIVVTERKEEIRELYFGKDTSIVTIDTVKTISIKDSILSKTAYKSSTIEIVPDTDPPKEFTLFTGFTASGKQVFEIKDPKPLNIRRQTGELDTLRVGSRTDAITTGNWR